MSDLSSLMKIAPISAAGMVGANNTQSMQSEALRQQQLQQIIQGLMQKNQQDQSMAPLLQEHQGLQNQGLKAGLGGIEGDSLLKQSNARKAVATEGSTIEATNAENSAKGVKAKAEQMGAMSQMLGNLGIELERTPDIPGARSAALMARLQSMGMDPQKPEHSALVQGLSKIPSAQLPAVLKQQAENALKLSREYIQARDTQQMQSDTSMAMNRNTNATQLELEDKRIEAGKYNKGKMAVTLEQSIDAAKSARERHQKLTDAATIAKQNGDSEAYARYTARAEAIRPQAQAEINSVKPGGVDVGKLAELPTNAGPQIAPPGGGPAPAGKAQVVYPENMVDLRKMYPGKSDAELKAAYKKKFGVDIK